jgi:GH24 family phage-related lysozyme (muramidase)
MPTLPNRPGKKSLAVVIGTVAASMAISLTSSQEGVSLRPYNDKLAGDLQTVCFGETNVQMRAYSMDECKEMLADSLSTYATQVRNLTPGFDNLTDGQKVAVIDLAYNIGIGNYAGSTLRKRYIAKDFPAACSEFAKWRFVRGRDCAIASNQCGGIWKRRQLERNACRGEQ